MRLEKLNDDNLIVFLNKIYIEKYKLSLKDNLENYFRTLFKILNDCHNIEIRGYYDISIYEDNIYGFIIDIKKEDIDFYNYYDDHIDMKINIIKYNKFIYQIDDYSLVDNKILKFTYLFKYHKNLYFIPKKNISQYGLGYIEENCKIIYGKKADEILNGGEYINTSKVFV